MLSLLDTLATLVDWQSKPPDVGAPFIGGNPSTTHYVVGVDIEPAPDGNGGGGQFKLANFLGNPDLKLLTLSEWRWSPEGGGGISSGRINLSPKIGLTISAVIDQNGQIAQHNGKYLAAARRKTDQVTTETVTLTSAAVVESLADGAYTLIQFTSDSSQTFVAILTKTTYVIEPF